MPDPRYPRPGELRWQAVIQALQPADSPANAYGEANDTWQALATVWCKRGPGAGGEKFLNGQVRSVSPWSVWIRYRPGIDSSMRLVLDVGTLNIANVNRWGPDAQGDWLELTCVEATE